MRDDNDVSASTEPTATQLRFGLPIEAFSRAWRIQDVAAYLGLEKSAAYRLMRDPGAPPRLRTGSTAYRWDGEQVMAWVRHMDWLGLHIDPNPSRALREAPTMWAAQNGEPVSVRAPRIATPATPEPPSTGRAGTGRTTTAHGVVAVPDERPNPGAPLVTGTRLTTVHVVDPSATQRAASEARMALLVGTKASEVRFETASAARCAAPVQAPATRPSASRGRPGGAPSARPSVRSSLGSANTRRSP